MSIKGPGGQKRMARDQAITDQSNYERLPYGYTAGHPTKARMRSKSYGLQDHIVPLVKVNRQKVNDVDA